MAEDKSPDGAEEPEDSDDAPTDEAYQHSGSLCPVCKRGRMARSLEIPRPTIMDLLLTPWRTVRSR